MSGFSQFFDQLRRLARERRCGFQLISGGSGPTACSDFGRALGTHPHAWNILLVDSDAPHRGGLAESLCLQYGWDKSHRGSIFWMVQMMESWFHADKDALENFYGSSFEKKFLKPNPKVEEIPKADLVKGLRKATKDTPKGDYFANKTLHGQKLLSVIDPNKVQKAAPNCKRLFAAVIAKLNEPASPTAKPPR
jgi:Domain of unknown function (DUF4276)